MPPRIYLDNNATTPLDPSVIQAIQAYLQEGQANPSSVHFFGQQARGLLNQARSKIAKVLHVKPEEICFTSGATEGLHMAIKGVLDQGGKSHIITSNVEHAAVYMLLSQYEKKGFEISYIPVGEYGAIDPQAVKDAIRPDTKLITIMAVNNETGVINPIAEIGAIAKAHGIPFVVDGVAWLGKEQVNIPAGVSAICFSGHKLHAPAGIGFTVLKSPFKVPPLFVGGPQEFGRRAGTENLVGIVGLAKAIEILPGILNESKAKMQMLREKLEKGLQDNLNGVSINGSGPRICNTVNLAFENVDGESLLMNLDQAGIAVSHGSACSSGALEPSRILLNMGLPLSKARSSLRFSLSRFNTPEDIDQTVAIITRLLPKLKK